ncbi:hypothetical protein BDV39DRAFT_210985 [Aspergillus sergii]|uniref:Uncharacterized protein n=1 Tax=Aspergillus sergii TaxID=1034303 RepID=A0A5N6WJY4_9EURO|nr:hypothetical protein BDV39DRAFT_210985 [Aspergillus sergii]
MGWLILTTAVVAIFQKRYFGSLSKSIASCGPSTPLTEGAYKRLQTRLGWFIDGGGKLRWGIEMEGHFDGGPGTQWVSAPHFSNKEDSDEWTCSNDEGPS